MTRAIEVPGPLLLGIAIVLDATTTLLGLGRGIPEAGPLARILIPVLGPAYFLLVYVILYAVARILYRILGGPGVLAAAVGPWLAGWLNISILLGD